MSRGNQFREPRRRGFDDDFAPSYGQRDFGGGGGHGREQSSSRSSYGGGGGHAAAAPSGPAIDATVKWFNPEKGFGFVELSDGSSDAFLHINALQAAGHDAVSPGAKLRVQVGQGAKGAQVTSVLEVDSSTATEQAPFRGGAAGGGASAPRAPRAPRASVDPSTAVEAVGSVKWFNPDKGFGFVACDDGRKDVFVHVSILGAAGLSHLPEGQRVSMRIVETAKGREAISLTLAD
jgi:CspA family cold shock protein